MFNGFFESLLVDYAKHLINLKNTKGNNEFLNEKKHRISSLKDKIKERSKKEKKMADETQKIINENLDYNRLIQTAFKKTESGSKPEESVYRKSKIKETKIRRKII